MNAVVLVDTSSWIHLLRPGGDANVRSRVEQLLADGEACWCPVVRLELWNGAGGERDRKVLREFEAALTELPIGADVWTASFDLARRARARGITAPATDLLIAACARVHDAGIEAADAEFAAIERV